MQARAELNSFIKEFDEDVNNLNQIDAISEMKTDSEKKEAVKRHHHKIKTHVHKLAIGRKECASGEEYVVVSSYTYPCPQAIPDLQFKLSKIARKVPTLGAMEHKIGLMNELDPELKSLEKDLNEITDFSDM